MFARRLVVVTAGFPREPGRSRSDVLAANVNSISSTRRWLMPTVALLEDEDGEQDTAMGVPCILDETGLASVVELDPNAEGRANIDSSFTVRD